MGIGCWGEYLGLGGTRWQWSGENYIMRSLMICTSFFFKRKSPPAGHGLLIRKVSRSHTTTHHTRCDEWSARRTDLYLTTHHLQQRHPCPGGIRTHNLSRRAAADLWLNHLTPNGHFSGRTAPLTYRCCIFFIYPTNIRTEYFKHAAHSLFFFPLFKMPFISFGSCIIHILYTGCVKFKRKFRRQRVKDRAATGTG